MGPVREQLAQSLFDHIPVGVGSQVRVHVCIKVRACVCISMGMREGATGPGAV